jgi:hypothetical protein
MICEAACLFNELAALGEEARVAFNIISKDVHSGGKLD